MSEDDVYILHGGITLIRELLPTVVVATTFFFALVTHAGLEVDVAAVFVLSSGFGVIVM